MPNGAIAAAAPIWPVMPMAYTRFMLMPSGFFPQNPALDVPPPTPKHQNGHCCH